MRGLICKDLLCLRKGLRSTLLVLLMYIALAFSGVWSLGVISGIMAVLVAMLPTNCFSYDYAAKWDLYARALPVSSAGVVAARYLTVGLLTALGGVFSVAVGLVGMSLGRVDDWTFYLTSCVSSMLVGLFFNAIMLPLLYRFGAERARIIFYGVLFGIAGVAFLVLVLLGGLDVLKNLEAPSPNLAAALPYILLAIGAALLAASFPLSLWFYKQKDP